MSSRMLLIPAEESAQALDVMSNIGNEPGGLVITVNFGKRNE